MDRVKEEVIEGDCTPWMDSAVVVKQEPGWSMEEDSPDQPSAVYSTAQPMSGNTSESLLSLKRGCVCQQCPAAFVLVSSLELHLASVHGEPLPFPEWTESNDRQMSLPHGRLSTEETDHVRKYSADSDTEFVLKLEPAWSMEEDSPDQPSAVYSTVQPMSDNTSGSLLSLKRGNVCQHCSATFVLVSSLELHLGSVHGEKLHMVLPGSSTPDRCDAGDCSIIDIGKEVDSHSNIKMKTKKIDDNDISHAIGKKGMRQYVCDVCRKSFPKPSKLKTHRLIHSSVKSFLCDICSKSFTQTGSLKMHMLTHSGHKPFVCDVYRKSFYDSSTLKKHILIHCGVKSFVCDVCSKSFSRSGSLTRHKRIHTGERPYKCPHCDSDFKESGTLQHHKKSVHEGARPHVCDVCGAAFSHGSHLTDHKRIHTGEKPHVCSDCGKSFAHCNSLARHRLNHASERPHVCSYCGKGFAQSYDLARHILTHTGEKPHLCSDCGKGFADSGSLRKHCLIHTGEKPYSCLYCPAAYRHSKDLKKHVQRKHQ